MACCHHFSFGRFQDPARISWGLLRVLNHNVLKASQQSPSQRHHNLETLFLVQAGTLLVRYGNDERLLVRTGQAAFVSAGFGVDLFLENPELVDVSYTEVAIVPETMSTHSLIRGVPNFNATGEGVILVSGVPGSVGLVTSDTRAVITQHKFRAGDDKAISIDTGSHAYLAVLHGTIVVENISLGQQDGLAVSAVERLRVQSKTGSEFLVIATTA